MNTFACISVDGQEFENPWIRRVRHPFNDLRSYRVWAMLHESLVSRQKAVVQQLVDSSKQADQEDQDNQCDNTQAGNIVIGHQFL